jgi:hypothetical protein
MRISVGRPAGSTVKITPARCASTMRITTTAIARSSSGTPEWAR